MRQHLPVVLQRLVMWGSFQILSNNFGLVDNITMLMMKQYTIGMPIHGNRQYKNREVSLFVPNSPHQRCGASRRLVNAFVRYSVSFSNTNSCWGDINC